MKYKLIQNSTGQETSCKIKAMSIEDNTDYIKYYVTPYYYKIGDTIP